MGYIYKITNKLNNKCYIGYTESPETRWKDHQYKRGSKVVYTAIKKYGVDNFTFEVIAEDTVENENIYIVEYNSMAPNGYNLVAGGGLPPCYRGKTYIEMYGSNDKAEKYRKKQLAVGGYGPKVHSEETKQKISKATTGQNNFMYGKKHSKETIAKMKESRKGQHAGSNHPKAKMIILVSPEGNEYKCFGTLRENCENLGLSYATMRAALKHNRVPKSGTAAGWRVYYD